MERVHRCGTYNANLTNSQHPLDTCGVLYRIGSETEDRQGGARPPRASNF